MKFSTFFVAAVSALTVTATPIAVAEPSTANTLEKRESKWNLNQIINCGNQKGKVVFTTMNWAIAPTRGRAEVTNEFRAKWEKHNDFFVGMAGTGALQGWPLNKRVVGMYPKEINCFADRMYDQWAGHKQLSDVVVYAQDGTHLMFMGWYVPYIHIPDSKPWKPVNIGWLR